jgi:photosystem II stability/assembly factor-like uncharacterized protein
MKHPITTHRAVSTIWAAWIATASVLALLAVAPTTSHGQDAISTADMASMHPRAIGPAVTGGRIHDIEALPDDPSTMLVGSASGGLWKTTNRGQTWANVFADMPVSTFGDIAISRSDPGVVYAGTGEQQNRQSSSYGNGVYRSDDGGDSWTHLGLDETRHIGKVLVHPSNPDIVYVGALGNLWAPSEERGVFKSTDGGRSWEKVLFVDEHTGVVDMAMDPSSPNTVYAATYQRLRRAWGFNGGGPGSGIWKSTDGGRTWNELGNGLPSGDKGRIGIAIAESNPEVLMALVESANDDAQGLYRTENGGQSWERVNAQNIRPMYYSHVVIDPTDDLRVYTLATRAYVSHDGGRTLSQIALSPTYDVGVHADHHTLWVDPTDPEHLYLGGDAGLHESYDRGVSFRRINNFPIAQFYAIAVDMRDPYWIYGGLQDNHSFTGPSENRRWAGILNDDWLQSGFSDGMYWQADPVDGRQAYGSSNGGRYFRYDSRTGDLQDISPPEPMDEEYRFDWTSPMMLSQHDPNVLYVAGNRLFVSKDRGSSWERTPDLSRRVDRDTLEIMGVRGSDITISRNDGTSSFGEAVTLDESPLDASILWVGFDDGNLQVSRDGGASWTEVSGNVSGIADGTYVSRIIASAASPGTAYATFDAHRDGDFRPYVYRTRDFGASWEPLHATLPEMGVVNVIVEHPDNPATLFLGTEHHAFASTDMGTTWARIPNLPTTHYDDMLVHPRERDLVMGTHGQGIWILDDTRAIAEWASASGPVTVFSAAEGTIRVYRKDTSYRAQDQFAGTNPVDGVELTYRLGPGSGNAALRVTGPTGNVVRTMTVPGEPGTHRVSWDLRHGLPDRSERWARFVSDDLARPIGDRGPWVSPGTYTVTVEARGATDATSVEVRGDPEMPISLAMYQGRERFMLDLVTLGSEIRSVMRANEMSNGGGGFGRAAGAPTTPRAKLQAAERIVDDVYGDLNGQAVRQGTLYPPTRTQRDQAAEARRLVAEARRELAGS